MSHPFVPLLVLGLVPALLLVLRLDGRARRLGGLALALLGAAIVVVAVAAGGVDLDVLKRMKLLAAAAVCSLLVSKTLGPRLVSSRSARMAVLAPLVLGCGLLWGNFFSFHGQWTFLHIHDVAHYYLGSKYFDELRYDGLYTGMLRAEAELYDNHFRSVEVRDLHTDRIVHIRELLAKSDEVKNRFTPRRWVEFKHDVAYFRTRMGDQYGQILVDHGYNPSPLWTMIGGTLADLVPAGSHAGIVALSAFDLGLLVVVVVAVGWAFGWNTALLAMLYLFLCQGGSFGWVGGAFLRMTWFAALIVGVCFLQRRRPVLAGALFVWSALLRVFPAAFLVGPACVAAWQAGRTGRVEPRLRRFLASAGIVASVLMLAMLSVPRLRTQWLEFASTMQRYVQNSAVNNIGLGEVLGYSDPAATASAEAQDEEQYHRQRAALARLTVFLPLTLMFVAWRARNATLLESVCLGVALLFAGVDVATYYTIYMMLFVLLYRERPRMLALLFGFEAASYLLTLFENRESVLFFYRNVLMLYALLALFSPAIVDEWRRLRDRGEVGSSLDPAS